MTLRQQAKEILYTFLIKKISQGTKHILEKLHTSFL